MAEARRTIRRVKAWKEAHLKSKKDQVPGLDKNTTGEVPK
jgi:hypothetical protein